MKILVDENMDEEFPEFMPNHDVFHVNPMGWQGMVNGELLTKAEEMGFAVLVTADKNMRHQQNLKSRSLSLIVLDIHPNFLAHQVECISEIEERLATALPGQI